MLVSKNSIKIILLLIFVLVSYQISKSSPNNYFAYGLVAIGFYLVYTEINISPTLQNINSSHSLPHVENMDNALEPPVLNESITPLEETTNNTSNDNNIDNNSTDNNDNTDDLMKKALELEKTRINELEELKQALIQPSSSALNLNNDKCDCNTAIAKAIAPLQVEVTKLRDSQKVSVNENEAKIKTYQLLLEHLMEKNILSSEDNETLKVKLTTGVLTVDEAINRLEKLKLAAINIKTPPHIESNKNWWSDMNKSELPAAMYLPLGTQIDSNFSNEYAILNTDKWAVPMPRPPVCIDSTPKEVMPVGTYGYPLNIKYFDEARYVTTSATQEKTKKELEQKIKELEQKMKENKEE
ncbi:hypothetical protein crov363 [Cafeteria roenbergensis virus]|uniref:Uncharacterized protein n=1 Tax=Cafeteria roenbergensis virus (strain BV-PW1) TaxID=693272 RepID=E3T5D4_CROVB|nr:hypothetical protein crov363 [Cafeteria roenbergensis virus BV-PW1]ADO67397.1 hypothetical protein crov363 [Cafeteria roenbergensis virus BV-PW1]